MVDLSYHHQSKRGELLEKIVNHTKAVKMLITSLMEFTVFSLMSLILFILMFAISWQLTLGSVFLGVIFIAALSVYMNQLSVFGERSSATRLDLTNAIQESLSAIRLIQSYHKLRQHHSFLIDKIEDNAIMEYQLDSKLTWIIPLSEGLVVSFNN